jgi:hypothetical protein
MDDLVSFVMLVSTVLRSMIQMSEPNNQDKKETSEKKVRGTITMTFLSDGSIDFNANVGMMDLWAASALLKIKGDEVYVSGMHEMKRQMDEANAKDPVRRLVLAKEIPEAKARDT